MTLPTTTILVGTDFSESARFALDCALEEARLVEHAELHVVSVIDDGAHHLLPAGVHHATLTQTVDRVRELLTAEIKRALTRHKAPLLRVPPIVHVRIGGIAEQIATLATEIRADRVVVGTHGQRGIRRLLMGSVAERTVRLAPCPVLVVRPKDFSAMAGLPAIAPPCPACLQTREESQGARWWCRAHEGQRESAHTYSFSGQLTDPAIPLHHVM